MERLIPQTPVSDPVAARELFFLELAMAELIQTVPQAAPATQR